MRTVLMCLSMLQVPRCRIDTLANFWQEGFHSMDRTYRICCSFRLLASKANGIEGGYSKRWIRRPVSTETKGRSKTTENSVCSDIRNEILGNKVSAGTTLNINNIEASEFQKIQVCDIRQEIAKNKKLAENVTVIVFDSETTGFGRDAQIIEIAFQDLKGGKNSTFQSLVNPGRHVPNSHIHGITTHMVCRPQVPRMRELIPILLQFIRNRQGPCGYVLLVAHNARSFDVPILMKEFGRCSIDIPSNWLFLDTLPLAREVFRAEGSKAPVKLSLEALSRKYNIKYEGPAHRAMADVIVLASVLQRLTIDLKLPLPVLVSKSFTPLDLTNSKKKNNSG